MGFAASLARGAIKEASYWADRASASEPGLVVLVYHRVGSGSGGQMDVDVSTFTSQMALLADAHRLVDLDTALTELAGPERVLPGVVVTFDDGTRDWLDHALPVLDRYRVPATFYVATRFVDEQTELPGGGRPITWDGLVELASSPLVTIGSHTHGHRLMDRLTVPEATDELRRCDDLLADHLGQQVRHFCYPKAVGAVGDVEQLVRDRYWSAVLAGKRANQLGANPHRLARSPIQASDRPRHVRAKITGGMGAEDRLRERVNRLRYRDAVT